MADRPSTTLDRRRFLKRTAVTGAAAAAGAGVVAAAGCSSSSKSGSGDKTETHVDVAIVGSGMSGLYAARTLGKQRSFVILEGNERTGGRVLNLKTGSEPEDVTEAGAQWISPKQRRANALVREFGLKTFKQYATGTATLILDGKVTRIETSLQALSRTVLKELGLLTELAGAVAELTAMAATVPFDAPWKAPKAEEWDNQTGASWVAANSSTPLAQYLLGFMMGGPVSALAQDISLLHYLFIASASGGPTELVVPGQGDLTYRIVGGTGRFVEGLERPMKDKIKLGTPVTMIEHGTKNVRLTTPSGQVVADHVILAMAPTMTQQILFDPVLPVDRNQSVQRIGMGSAIKAFPVYSKPFWRDKGLSGSVFSNSSVFGAAFDNSPPSGSPGVLFALIENVQARRLSALSPEARKKIVLDDLAVAFGDEARHPIRYVEQDWSSEPWIRGGAAAVFPPGVLSEYRYLFDKPIGRLHFASTETGRQWWGNMEAAMASGERAAREILSA
jgi:monoamine oxidase